MNCANHPDRERTAFCQNCGKPLCTECTRTVGSAVFCEPCLAARLASSEFPKASSSYAATAAGANYSTTGAIPPPTPAGEPNPGLAALLGFIPGVGAMYNGQYAKGIVHLIVFAILVSLADEHGIFGLFIAGWVFYMVIEAHHTARARRDGTPLPNPFGLNDFGDRLGFGRSWPSVPTSTYPGASPTPDAYAAASPPYTQPAPGAPPYTPPPTNWGAPTDAYTYAAATASPSAAYTGVPTVESYVPPPSRFPAGAIWLIALGTLFLVGNIGLFHGFPIQHIFPIFLIALGIWLFYRKMAETGPSLTDDGTPGYRYRLSCAIRGSGWLVLVGIIYLLADFRILYWHQSWPLFLIFAGLMIFLRRTSFYHPAYPYPATNVPPTSQSVGTSVVPVSEPKDQERR